jgi:phospholipid/cholesterol/gamma-HCH transport system substrate-binding protein
MERAPLRAPLIKNLELKIGLLLALTALLVVAFVGYTLYARGAFQTTQSLVLTAPEAEGVSIGQSLTFSGFPLGEVKRLGLTPDGQVRIEVAIARDDAKWLRTSSVFSLEKSFVGGAKIKVVSPNLNDPQLPDGATRPLVTGDVSQEIPVLIARVKAILDNVQAMTDKDAPINKTLTHVETVTGRMAGDYGVLGGVMGSPDKAQQVVGALEKANSLLNNLNGVSLKVDGMLAKADRQVFDKNGTLDQANQAVAKLNSVLGDVRESLKKADSILANVDGISANVKDATTDLGQLRADVDDSLRKVNHLINEINRKWPFARDVEIKAP